MNIEYGQGKTKYGRGVSITLSGQEVARAIYAYLTAHQVDIEGPATITVNGELIKSGSVYVDPAGCVVDDWGKKWDGRTK